jgi:hypothetical protein
MRSKEVLCGYNRYVGFFVPLSLVSTFTQVFHSHHEHAISQTPLAFQHIPHIPRFLESRFIAPAQEFTAGVSVMSLTLTPYGSGNALDYVHEIQDGDTISTSAAIAYWFKQIDEGDGIVGSECSPWNAIKLPSSDSRNITILQLLI